MQFLLRAFEPLYREFISFERMHEIVKYGIVGVTGLLVNLIVNYVLHEHIWYLYASVIAFFFTFLTSFTLQKWWTFNNRSMGRVHVQASIAIMTALGNLFLNTVLMYIAVTMFGFFYLYSQALITLCIAVESYLMYKFVIFEEEKNEVQKTS